MGDGPKDDLKEENKRTRWEADVWKASNYKEEDNYFYLVMNMEVSPKLYEEPEFLIKLTALNYVEKLGDAAWGYFVNQIRKDQDWTEAELQAKLIERRLAELKGSKTSEGAFLQFYARRALLPVYANGGPQVPGLPGALINILRDGCPDDAALKKLLAHLEKRPMSKRIAMKILEWWPDATQGELANEAHVTDKTIRDWAEELKAVGWGGPPQKTIGPPKQTKPQRGTPSLPKLKFMEGAGPKDD